MNLLKIPAPTLLLALLAACAPLPPTPYPAGPGGPGSGPPPQRWIGRISSIEGRNAFVDPAY